MTVLRRPETTAAPSLRCLSQQLGALINITRTIDRNSEDADHGRDGEIFYVFDTNVIQMFLEPIKNPHFTEIFFGPIWGRSAVRRPGPTDDEVNMQSCLIAAEYLMSGELPGQARGGGKWIMTRGHEAELDRQFGHLIDRGRETAARLASDERFFKFALDQILNLEAVLNLDASKDRDDFIRLADKHGVGSAHLPTQLKNLDAEKFRERAEGIRSHEICRLLASETISEPANQLARLRTPLLLGKRQILEERLGLKYEDWDEIRDDAAEWRKLLAIILQRQPGKTKTTAALSADCEALALVAWANRHWAAPDQRVVFVTGDRALMEACRQRYVEDPQQQFFVRAISQFAPLFNPTSAKSQVERSEAFERLRTVLEGAMVALNLGLLAGDPELRARARDGFALLVDQAPDSVEEILRSFFPRAADPNWVKEQQVALGKLVDDLRATELLMLEAYPTLVARRLDVDQRRTLVDAAKSGGDVLSAAIGSLLNRAKAESARFSTYMMPAAVEELLRLIKHPDAISQRVSIQIRLPFTETSRFQDFRETVSWLKQLGPRELEETLLRANEQPESIFALAAMLSFSLEIWKEAARYADLAVRASYEVDSPRPKRAGAALVDQFELLFLQAISLRFRIKSGYLETAAGTSGGWRDWSDRALTILDDCFRHHAEAQEYARAVRALSERAALRLAQCEIALFVTEPDRLDAQAIDEVVANVRHAIEDLAQCEVFAALGAERVRNLSRHAGGEASQSVLAAAERQFLYNTYAAKVVASVCANRFPAFAQEMQVLISAVPTRDAPPWPNKPAISSAYMLAAEANWNDLAEIDPEGVSLALDEATIRGLRRFGAETRAV